MTLAFIVCIVTVVIVTFGGNVSAQCSARWTKLNRLPVCFGAAGGKHGSFEVDRNLLVHQIKFVHRSGLVWCAPGMGAFFGCRAPSVKGYVGVFLTDAKNHIIVPVAPTYPGFSQNPSWYRVQGFENGATAFALTTGIHSHEIRAGQVLRMWYGEDLYNKSESDNGGQSCIDIYGLV